MDKRWTQRIGFLLLALYAACVLHQILPHEAGHGHAAKCPLCLLLTSLLVFGPYVSLFLQLPRMSYTVVPHTLPFKRETRTPYSLRGPPTPA